MPKAAIIEAELRAFIHDGVVAVLAGDPRNYQTELENLFAEVAIRAHDFGLDDAVLLLGEGQIHPEVLLYVNNIRAEIRALRFRLAPAP